MGDELEGQQHDGTWITYNLCSCEPQYNQIGR